MSYKSYLVILSTLLFFSCATSKNQVLWVSGNKTECTGGAGKMQCLQIQRGESIDEAKWENFYAGIEGFTFEEGMMQKIEVKEEKIENAPADASNLKYTLIKVLEKQMDSKVMLSGKWILATINNGPINRSIKLPSIEFLTDQKKVVGNGGCNTYTGPIDNLNHKEIKLGNLVSTKKACGFRHIEQDFFTALNTVRTYEMKDDQLVFRNENGEEVLSFLQQAESKVDERIHDIWGAVEIFGKEIVKNSIPTLEINLRELKVFGNDGCNQYSGEISEVSEKEIMIGPLASTRKMCPEMENSNNYNKAISQVAQYKLDGSHLKLLDGNGKEVIVFKKGD